MRQKNYELFTTFSAFTTCLRHIILHYFALSHSICITKKHAVSDFILNNVLFCWRSKRDLNFIKTTIIR
nr:MAG TPA: hypothetical protein [Bacteriophage sp.]